MEILSIRVFLLFILTIMMVVTVFMVWKKLGCKDSTDSKKPSVLFMGIPPRCLHTWRDWLESGFEISTKSIEEIKSLDNLQPFNVVIIGAMPCMNANGTPPEKLTNFVPIFRKYLEKGGGVFVLDGGGRFQLMVDAQNYLMKPYGIQLIKEQVTDPNHAFPVRYLSIATTENLGRGPMMKGIIRAGYISSQVGTVYTTLPLKIIDKSAWQVIIRGEKSARSAEIVEMKAGGSLASTELSKTPGTYDSEPIFGAWRIVGKGRLLVLPQNNYFITTPEHFDNVLWTKDESDNKPQNRRLYHQIIRWLAAPSLASRALGGFVTAPDWHPQKGEILDREGQFKPKDWSKTSPIIAPGTEPRTYLNGVIGAMPASFGGEGTVNQWCDAAKQQELGFLGFTADLKTLNAKKWQEFKNQCDQASDEKFLAIPGLMGLDKEGNTWFGLGWFKYPEAPILTEDGNRINSTYLFWAKICGIRFSGFARTLTNPNTWYEMKHASAMAVLTSEPGKTLEDATEVYLQSCRKQENYIPVAFSLIHSPEDLKTQSGKITNRFTAGGIETLRDYLNKTGRFAKKMMRAESPHPWFLSQGPVLTVLSSQCPGGYGADEELRNRYKFGFRVDGLKTGDCVELYDGPELKRQWEADGDSFSMERLWPLDQSRHWLVRVVRNEQTAMLSSPVFIHFGPFFNQCGDRQNTLPYNYQPDEHGNYYVVGIPIGAHYRSWPPDTLVYGSHAVLLIGGCGFEHQPPTYSSFRTSPEIPFAGQILSSRSLASYQFPKLSCSGIIIVDEVCNRFYPNGGRHLGGGAPPKKTEPLELFEFRQRRYGLYTRVGGVNGQYVESEIISKAENELKSDWVKVSDINIPVRDNSSQWLELSADNKFARYSQQNPLTKIETFDLVPGNYAGVYPNGYPRGGAEYVVNGKLIAWIRGGKENQGQFICLFFLKVPTQWKPGKEFKYSILYTTGGSEPFTKDSEYQQVVDYLGLREGKYPAIVKVEGGILTKEPVIATVQVEKPTETVRFETQKLSEAPMALPIRFRGYQPNWQFAYKLNDSSRWRFCGELDGDFYFHLRPHFRADKVVAGHPITADNDQVIIILNDFKGENSDYEIYNPNDKPLKVKLVANPSFLPEWSEEISLQPLQSKQVWVRAK